ncbi:hypothetical protein [Streptomyces djakartensis]|uniref:hypothetical protein n=1 Tax=Streptomyces djakartensis TaxID=68193 RepID=UPI003F7D2C48
MCAFSGSVLLTVDVTTGRTGGIVAGGATLVVRAGLWGPLPRLVRRAGPRAEPRAAAARDGAGDPGRAATAGPAPERRTVAQPPRQPGLRRPEAPARRR